MADFPFTLADRALAARLARAMDPEGKIPRALDAIGALAGRDVLVLGPARSLRAAQVRDLGARVATAPVSGLAACPDRSADVLIACWTPLERPDAAAEEGHAQAARILRPGGRLLLLADYGRDDVARLTNTGTPPAERGHTRARDTWFTSRGFRLRVIHAWWTFDSCEDAADFLRAAFGEPGGAVAEGLRRPRLAHKLVVYHRAFDGAEG